MTPRTLAPLALSMVLAASLTACGNDDTSTPAAAPTSSASPSSGGGDDAAAPAASGSVQAQDQTSDGTSLSVAQVDLEGIDQGFIGVHMDLDGKPGPVVGVAQVEKGTTQDLEVRFDKPVASGAFWPMLHVDDHAIGTYEFTKVAGADLPVKDGEQVVMKKITLTVS
jgi:hypothetical protein